MNSGGSKGGGDMKEEVLRMLGRTIILQVVDGKYRAPVMTLHNGEIGSLYNYVVEKHLRTEYLPGAEKFWKVVRTDQNLETWRPRVQGTQLKALLNARLPETEEEFDAVEAAVAGMQHVLRPDSSPKAFAADLRKFIANVEVWWDNRNKKAPAAAGAGAGGGGGAAASGGAAAAAGAGDGGSSGVWGGGPHGPCESVSPPPAGTKQW